MKKRFLTALMAVILLITGIPANVNAASVTDFTDVNPGEWYYSAIDHAAKAGWFSGTTKTTFSPGTSINRGMFVTVLGRFAKIPDTYTSPKPPFWDVMKNSYYAPYSACASDLDVVSGVGNNRFAPEDTVTREQMAVLLFRYSMKSNITVAHNENIYNGFSDTSKVSSYAVDALKWATYYGIINGSGGKINPQGKATRAEVAQIFMNFESFVASPTPVTPVPETPTPSPSPTPENPEEPGKMPWEDYDPQYTRKTGQSAKDADGGYYDFDLANEIMDQINALRVENGLNELAYHPQIQDWASIRAKELEYVYSNANGNVTSEMAHTRPDGTRCFTVSGNANVLQSENALYAAQYSLKYSDIGKYASEIVESWYNSIGHRQAMLKKVSKNAAISCYVKNDQAYLIHLFSDFGVYRIDKDLGWIE